MVRGGLPFKTETKDELQAGDVQRSIRFSNGELFVYNSWRFQGVPWICPTTSGVTVRAPINQIGRVS